MMNTIKLALALAVGLAVTSTQAATYTTGELIIGFTAETGNDFEYNLGAASAITNGQTWNLSSPLASFDLTTAKWGVIGSDANAGYAYATKATGTPSTVSASKWNRQDIAVGAIYSLFSADGVGSTATPIATYANSWDQQTIASLQTTTYKNSYMNPNVTGLAANKFYRTLSGGTAPVQLGSFSLAANGVVTFTAFSSAPSAPTLTITRSGDDNLISFLSANSGTYTLCFTNSTGLTAPVITWPTQLGTITGNGSTKTFTNTTTDADRFYRVKAQ